MKKDQKTDEAAEEKQPIPPKIENRKEWLTCKLTSEELLKYGDECARCRIDMLDIEARLSSVRKELQAQVEQKDARIRELASKIQSRTETRDVPVVVTHDYEKQRVFCIRQDTGEVVWDRTMTASESQVEMKDLL